MRPIIPYMVIVTLQDQPSSAALMRVENNTRLTVYTNELERVVTIYLAEEVFAKHLVKGL